MLSLLVLVLSMPYRLHMSTSGIKHQFGDQLYRLLELWGRGAPYQVTGTKVFGAHLPRKRRARTVRIAIPSHRDKGVLGNPDYSAQGPTPYSPATTNCETSTLHSGDTLPSHQDKGVSGNPDYSAQGPTPLQPATTKCET